MLKRLRRMVPVLMCLALGAWAQDSMVLTGAGAWAAMGGVYTSPYQISINYSAIATPLICDDYTTDISLGQSWTADATTLTTVDSGDVGNLKFANASYSPGIVGAPTSGPAPLTIVALDYATAAVLAAELLTSPGVGTSAEDPEAVGELSYALWGVFDASLLNSTSTGFGTLGADELANAQADLLAAQVLVNTHTSGGVTNLSSITVNGAPIASMTVYTPISPNGLKSSQEFITVDSVAMPEPSYPSILALDLLAAAGLGFAFRRRRSSVRS